MRANSISFDELFEEYRPLVLRVAMRFLGSPQDAEDVAQEVFTKVWRGIGDFQCESSLKTWIYRIAVNACLDHARRPWKRRDQGDTPLEEVLERFERSGRLGDHDTAERRLLVKEKSVLLRRAITKLKPDLKAVFVMKEIEEMSYEEISSRLGLSTGTISSRLNRARKALQQTFSRLTPALARG
jgi:RNA polymerase sigma-70 factor (ECF subfamily)